MENKIHATECKFCKTLYETKAKKTKRDGLYVVCPVCSGRNLDKSVEYIIDGKV